MFIRTNGNIHILMYCVKRKKIRQDDKSKKKKKNRKITTEEERCFNDNFRNLHLDCNSFF